MADSTLFVTFSLQPFSFAFRVFVCPVACLSRGIHSPCSSGAYFTGVKAIQPGRSLFNRGDNPFPSNEVLLKRSAPSASNREALSSVFSLSFELWHLKLKIQYFLLVAHF
jgi:hypothetical protein